MDIFRLDDIIKTIYKADLKLIICGDINILQLMIRKDNLMLYF